MIPLGRLDKLPMPPSVNACYVTVGRKRVASRDLKTFKRKAQAWAYLNKQILKSIKTKVEEHLALNCKVRLDFVFRFPAKKLWRKSDRKAKKLDVSNRIKPAEDVVCSLLGFDDRIVFRISAEKVCGEVEEFSVYVSAWD